MYLFYLFRFEHFEIAEHAAVACEFGVIVVAVFAVLLLIHHLKLIHDLDEFPVVFDSHFLVAVWSGMKNGAGGVELVLEREVALRELVDQLSIFLKTFHKERTFRLHSDILHYLEKKGYAVVYVVALQVVGV